MKTSKVWFITGASKGLGLSLVKLLLSKGHKVAATSRKASDIEKQVNYNTQNLLALTVDITDPESVNDAIDKTIKKFDGLDVVVNNAGFGLFGSIEELSLKEFKDSVSVNVFGAFNVIHSAMPYLRNQKSGNIINISSVAGYKGYPGSASYSASKFALEGLSESLADEARPFNVKVTVVSPGYFRTNFLDEGSFKMAEKTIPEYNNAEKEDGMKQMNGNQPGDPEKLVNVLLNLTQEENPPIHLLMGPDAYGMVKTIRKENDDEIEQWKHITLSTNFDN